jgi:hypothetical protein
MKTANPEKAATCRDAINRVSNPTTPAPSNAEGSFSYYVAPVSTTVPLKNVTLAEVYELVVTDFLQTHTENVRSGKASKTKVLPSITCSGIFKRRSLNGLITYNPCICIDLDHCDTGLKTILAHDPVLKPALVFTSPSGSGMKLFVQISGGTEEDHLAHWNAIAHYLLTTYSLVADPACKDKSRCCFLAWDPSAIFTNGSIDSVALLALLPQPAPLPPLGGPGRSSAAPATATATATAAATAPYFSTATSVPAFGNPTYTTDDDLPSNRLNRLSTVHLRACSALISIGWRRIGNTDYWTRDGKDNGVSGVFNFYEKEQMEMFTCFTSNSSYFGRRGYTNIQIINIIEFHSDWNSCITQLAHEYL